MSDTPKTTHEDEIDLIALAKKVYQNRVLIIKLTALSFLFGVVLAAFSPVRFNAGSTFIPQTSGNQPSSSLSGLASLAGVNLWKLTEGGSEIPPSLYPNIVSSIPYRLALLETPIDTQNTTLKDYLQDGAGGFSIMATIKKYTIGLPGLLLNLNQKQGENSEILYRVTEEDKVLFAHLKETLSVVFDEKEGFVFLSYESDDPKIAAIVAQSATTLLQKKIISFRIQNALESLSFVAEQYDSKKVEFEQLQDSIARFKDKNLNISSSLFQNELERLNSNFTIVSSVFQELAGQLEQAKLQVSKDTPIFTVIEPVSIPMDRSKPKRVIMVVIWSLLGAVLAVGWSLVQSPVKVIVKQIRS